MNPWVSVWFRPYKTAEWVKHIKPLYGVAVVLVLYLLITLLSVYFDSVTSANIDTSVQKTSEMLSGKHNLGMAIDTWLMPVLLVFVSYWVGKYLGGQACMQNILWVLVWSQLPIILLSLLTMAMELAGLQIGAPLLNNKISFPGGLPMLDPPEPDVNMHELAYLLISMPLLLSSFQILLSGTAAVQGVTVQRAIWFVLAAMVVLMLVRLPISLALGDWDILDVLGLRGIVELDELGAVVQ